MNKKLIVLTPLALALILVLISQPIYGKEILIKVCVIKDEPMRGYVMIGSEPTAVGIYRFYLEKLGVPGSGKFEKVDEIPLTKVNGKYCGEKFVEKINDTLVVGYPSTNYIDGRACVEVDQSKDEVNITVHYWRSLIAVSKKEFEVVRDLPDQARQGENITVKIRFTPDQNLIAVGLEEISPWEILNVSGSPNPDQIKINGSILQCIWYELEGREVVLTYVAKVSQTQDSFKGRLIYRTLDGVKHEISIGGDSIVKVTEGATLTPTVTPVATQPTSKGEKQPGFEFLLALLGLAIVAYLGRRIMK